MEIVAFSYKKIRWIYEPDGIEAEDCFCVNSWRECSHPFEDIMGGLEFGFKASWEIMRYSFGEVILSDVILSLLNFLPISLVSGFLMGRGVSLRQINENFKSLERDTKKLSSRIETIRNNVFFK